MTLRQWVGAAVRDQRQKHGKRQDDLAQAARGLGLAWTRSKVAALERGEKAIPAEELVLLPAVLMWADCGEPQLRDLLPDGTSEMVLLNERMVLAASVIGLVARNKLRHFDVAVGDPREIGGESTYDWAEHSRFMRGHEAIWSGTPGGGAQAYRDSARDAEQAAARKLGVPAEAVSSAAHATWGRGLTEERNARAAAQQETAIPGTAQAAGHVTRELYRELRPALDRWRAAVDAEGQG